MPGIRTLPAIFVIAALLMACTGAGSPSATALPSTAASQAASAEPTPDPCATDNLANKAPGILTVGTDNPTFPPYFSEPVAGEEITEPWQNIDPNNGRGFESAVAYALAEQLGFTADQVEWIPVTFNHAIAPAPKDFDVYISQ